ncbi:MDR family MFS transporter [Paenibacillus elgii]|uniref:MDR family MFS transporter n=1 Tax=Paenibacillus elgii TaxID=189691 RepID=UPI000FDC0DEF|nr:MFS transporter [Paenibacillus elgii]NEN87095.1 MFS transporter [Paenibacillus elgii]
MRFRDFHPNVKLRIIMSFLTGALGSMVVPFMSVYFAKTLGATAAGFVAIFNIMVGLVFAMLGGYYADRVGRKRMMLISEAAIAAAYLVMAAVNSPWCQSPVATLVMTVVVSASWGLHKPAIEAMLIDVTEPHARQAMYRISYWTNNLSVAAAGMIGAVLFADYLFELFLAVGLMTFVSFAVTWVFITEAWKRPEGGPTGAAEPKKGKLWANYRQVLRDKVFMVYVGAFVLLYSVEINLVDYIAIRLEKEMRLTPWLPWTDWQIDGMEMLGVLRTENTLLVVLLSLMIASLIRHRSDSRIMYAGLVLSIAGYSFLAYSNQPVLLVLMMFVATVGELIYVPLSQALLVNIVPDHARSSYMAINGMAFRGGMILGGVNIILGGVLPGWGMAVVIFMTGVAGLLMLRSVMPVLNQGSTSSKDNSSGNGRGTVHLSN